MHSPNGRNSRLLLTWRFRVRVLSHQNRLKAVGVGTHRRNGGVLQKSGQIERHFRAASLRHPCLTSEAVGFEAYNRDSPSAGSVGECGLLPVRRREIPRARARLVVVAAGFVPHVGISPVIHTNL